MSNKKKGLVETFIKNEEKLQQSENTPQTPAEPEKRPKANTRVGKRHIGGYFEEKVWAQLKIMSVEKGGMTLQEMLAEALNNYFKVNDKPPIAK
jgi:hypothetical protein